jgi:ribosomal protein S6
MAQKKNTGNMFEFTFLVDEASALKQVEKALTESEGKKTAENFWGKRLLSYSINKKTAAEFYTWHIQIDPHKIDELKQKLNYEKLVIRYIILTAETSTKQVKKPAIKEEETSVE